MAEPTDLPGYQNTRWGMTADQVLMAVGVERVQRTPRQQFLQCYSDMKIPNVPVGGLPFDVIFQMDEQSHQLRQVLVLHRCDPSREPTEETSATRAVLEERFGKTEPVEGRNTLLWLFPTTTIALDSACIAGNMSVVGVRFFPTGHDPNAPAQRPDGG